MTPTTGGSGAGGDAQQRGGVGGAERRRRRHRRPTPGTNPRRRLEIRRPVFLVDQTARQMRPKQTL